MLCKLVIICGVIAAVANIKIGFERVEDLKKRLEDIKNQLHGDDTESRSEAVTEIIAKISTNISRKSVQDSFLCGMCFLLVDELLSRRRIQLQSEAYIKKLALELCVDFEIQSEEVCHGVIEFNMPSILYVIDNRPGLTADSACKIMLNEGDCMLPFTDETLDFEVDIDNGTSSKVFKVPLKESAEDLTVIHISDIHVDFKYAPGAFTDCDEPACCREIDATNETDFDSIAGPWGDYRNCDTPWLAVVDAFNQIRKQHSKIDAVYFTGDIVNHFVWDASIEGMKSAIEKVFNLMRNIFVNVPVYSALGNHEAQNLFPPTTINETNLSIRWLYDHIAMLWMSRLPPDAIETVKSGGYYTSVLRPGLRLIALNNNVCFTFNWWIFYDVQSIRSQFQWLHDVLLAAEKSGEKVHILAHIPNNDEDYYQPCSREFRRIVDRFHETIAGQFVGHTEYFGFNLFSRENNLAKPLNIAWNGGSLATFTGVNRNYVKYTLDPVSHLVNDVESWIYNLTDANHNHPRNPIWLRQFSFRDAFNLKDLSPATMGSFAENMLHNVTAIQQLWRMKISDSDVKLQEGCNKSCLQQTLCETLIADNFDTAKCQKIKKEVDGR